MDWGDNRPMKLELAEDDRPPAELSLDDYLHSSFRPDCDFVDGRSEERNVGIFNHSALVTAIMVAMHLKRDEWNAQVLPSLRMKVLPTRVRVPDLCLISRYAPKFLTWRTASARRLRNWRISNDLAFKAYGLSTLNGALHIDTRTGGLCGL